MALTIINASFNLFQKKRELSAQREETVRQKEESTKRFNERLIQIEPHHSNLKVYIRNI